MKEILNNKIFLVMTMAVLIFGGAIYFWFQEFAQVEEQLASLQKQVKILEESAVPVTSSPESSSFTPDGATEGEEPLSSEALAEEDESEPEVNRCDSLNCDILDGWVNSGSIYSCQDGYGKTCACQKQNYHNYSCSSLKQECVYSITDARINKYNCLEPEPEPEYSDLIVQSPSFSPANPTEEDNMTFWATIKNQGEASVASSLSYLSIDGQKFAEFSTMPLVGNDSVVVTGAATWTAVAGEHELELCADGDSAIEESNELNNCAETTFTVAAAVTVSQPDLIVQSVSISPASSTADQSLTFTGTVKNQGEDSAGSSSALLELDLNNNGTWESFGTMGITALQINGTKTESWWNIWMAVTGTHQFKICADVASEVAESDETNNCSSQVFTVQ